MKFKRTAKLMGFITALTLTLGNLTATGIADTIAVYNESLIESAEESSSEAPSEEGSIIDPSEEGSTADPTEEGSTADPSEEGSTTDPSEEGSTADPTEEGSTADPTEEGSTADSTEEGTITDPTEEGSTADPIEEGSTADPTEEGSITDPSEEGSLPVPTNEGQFKDPALQTPPLERPTADEWIITAFMEPTLSLFVPYGTAREDLVLPDIVYAEIEDNIEGQTVETEQFPSSGGELDSAANSTILAIPVVWQDLDDYNSGEPGDYRFQAVITDPEFIALTDTPIITVTVEERLSRLASPRAAAVLDLSNPVDDDDYDMYGEVIVYNGTGPLTIKGQGAYTVRPGSATEIYIEDNTVFESTSTNTSISSNYGRPIKITGGGSGIVINGRVYCAPEALTIGGTIGQINVSGDGSTGIESTSVLIEEGAEIGDIIADVGIKSATGSVTINGSIGTIYAGGIGINVADGLTVGEDGIIGFITSNSAEGISADAGNISIAGEIAYINAETSGILNKSNDIIIETGGIVGPISSQYGSGIKADVGSITVSGDLGLTGGISSSMSGIDSASDITINGSVGNISSADYNAVSAQDSLIITGPIGDVSGKGQGFVARDNIEISAKTGKISSSNSNAIISMTGDILIKEGADIESVSSDAGSAIQSSTGKINIDGSVGDIESKNEGIYAATGLTVGEGADIASITSANSQGIYVTAGNVSIAGEIAEIKAYADAIKSNNGGGITITGSGSIGTVSSDTGYGLIASMGAISIEGELGLIGGVKTESTSIIADGDLIISGAVGEINSAEVAGIDSTGKLTVTETGSIGDVYGRMYGMHTNVGDLEISGAVSKISGGEFAALGSESGDIIIASGGSIDGINSAVADGINAGGAIVINGSINSITALRGYSLYSGSSFDLGQTGYIGSIESRRAIYAEMGNISISGEIGGIEAAAAAISGDAGDVTVSGTIGDIEAKGGNGISAYGSVTITGEVGNISYNGGTGIHSDTGNITLSGKVGIIKDAYDKVGSGLIAAGNSGVITISGPYTYTVYGAVRSFNKQPVLNGTYTAEWSDVQNGTGVVSGMGYPWADTHKYVKLTYTGPVTHKVSYNANGGEGRIPDVTVNEGGNYTIAENGFTMPGNIFTGWNTKTDGNGTAYNPGDRISNVQGNIVLYAQWQLMAGNEIIAVLSPLGAVISGMNIAAEVQDSIAALTVDVEVSANASWKLYADSNCQNEIALNTMALVYGANTAYIKVTGADNSSAVYTLTVTKTQSVYTVSYNANGGNGVMPGGSVLYGQNYKIDANKFSRDNYRFTGWNTEPDGSGKAYSQSESILEVKADITLYAQWEYKDNNRDNDNNHDNNSDRDDDDRNNDGRNNNRPSNNSLPPSGPSTPVSVDDDGPDNVANVNLPGTSNVYISENMVMDALAALKGKDGDIAISFELNPDTVTIDRNALLALQKAGVSYIEIHNPVTSIKLDLGAIEAVLSQTAGNITISAIGHDKLSFAALSLIGNRPVFDITIKDATGKIVSDIQDGTVTIGLKYTLTGDEKPEGLKAVYVDSFGRTLILEDSVYIDGKIVFDRKSLSIYGIGYREAAPEFSDISDHWSKEFIDYAVGMGLLSGTGGGSFSPEDPVTRGDFLMALAKLSYVNMMGYMESSFTDVPSNSVIMPYIEWAVKNQIVSGMGEGQFGPYRPISREQMAVMIMNFVSVTGHNMPVLEPANIFTDDGEISDWAKIQVTAIQQAGLINGRENNCFDPQGGMTRAEAASVLFQFVNGVIEADTARGWSKNGAGQWQYIDQYGEKVTGWFTNQNNGKYWFNESGIMAADKWTRIDGNWYFFGTDGKLAVNTVVDGYTVGADGARVE